MVILILPGGMRNAWVEMVVGLKDGCHSKPVQLIGILTIVGFFFKKKRRED